MCSDNNGSEIRSDGALCDISSADQTIVTESVSNDMLDKHKYKLKFIRRIIAAIASVTIVATITAVVIPIVFPPMVTVTVLTGVKYTDYQSGEPVVNDTVISYDEFGNPDYNPNFSFQRYFTSLITTDQIASMEFDDRGNLLVGNNEQTYEYEYDSDDRIKNCTVYRDGEERANWEFYFDENGNLIQAISDMEDCVYEVVRADFAYDKDDRLIEEYIFLGRMMNYSSIGHALIECSIYAYVYAYDEAGNLATISLASSGVQMFTDSNDYKVDLENIEFEFRHILQFEYDNDGRIDKLNSRPYTSGPNESDDGWQTYVFKYDQNGNLMPDDHLNFSQKYDDSGKLTRVECFGTGNETNPYTVLEYQYEDVKMSKTAAQRYANWEKMLNLDYGTQEFHARMYAAVMRVTHEIGGLFFYYLVPNPLW